MMERVEHVAGEFRKAAHSQMAATTQRTIRSVMMVMMMVLMMVMVVMVVMVMVVFLWLRKSC